MSDTLGKSSNYGVVYIQNGKWGQQIEYQIVIHGGDWELDELDLIRKAAIKWNDYLHNSESFVRVTSNPDLTILLEDGTGAPHVERIGRPCSWVKVYDDFYYDGKFFNYMLHEFCHVLGLDHWNYYKPSTHGKYPSDATVVDPNSIAEGPSFPDEPSSYDADALYYGLGYDEPEPPPTAPIISFGAPVNNHPKIQWSAVTGAKGYKVFKKRVPYEGSFHLVKTTLSTYYVPNDVCIDWVWSTVKSTVYWKVKAYNSAGETGFSNQLSKVYWIEEF